MIMVNALAREHVSDGVLDPGAAADLRGATPNFGNTEEQYITDIVPRSRKEERKQRKHRHTPTLPTPPESDNESTSRTPPNNPPRRQRPIPDGAQPLILSQSMPLFGRARQKAYPLLVCSIGNPGSTYADTLHSTGHTLTSFITQRKVYNPFKKGMHGLYSRPDTMSVSFGLLRGPKRIDSAVVPVEEDWTFWQSTSYMNVSGDGLKRAYTEWQKTLKSRYDDPSIEGRLVVLHDELESDLGKVTVKDGAASAKGHNGLKSCQKVLGSSKWWRIGMGIGRPSSREPDDVARYVLKKMSERERAKIEDNAIHVVKMLEKIAEGRL